MTISKFVMVVDILITLAVSLTDQKSVQCACEAELTNAISSLLKVATTTIFNICDTDTQSAWIAMTTIAMMTRMMHVVVLVKAIGQSLFLKVACSYSSRYSDGVLSLVPNE